jgi:hypothetical protein
MISKLPTLSIGKNKFTNIHGVLEDLNPSWTIS